VSRDYASSAGQAVLHRKAGLSAQLTHRSLGVDASGRCVESADSIRRRHRALRALGQLATELRLHAIRFVKDVLPDAATLLELGTGLDPLTWLHNAGGGGGKYWVIAQCSTAAQRTNVENQLTSAGIAKSRPPTTPADWWSTMGSAQFPGVTSATWAVLRAYAAIHSTQLVRIVDSLEKVAAFKGTIEQQHATVVTCSAKAEATKIPPTPLAVTEPIAAAQTAASKKGTR
jgi:hypothetical protein